MRIDTHTPHVEAAWAEAFLLELRLRGVAGASIGAALAEVEAHCADSGESASEAFGDPAAYASALELPPSPRQNGPLVLPVLGAALGLVGMFTTAGAVAAWQTDTTVRVTLGALLVAAVLLGCFAALAVRTDQVLRLVVHRPVVATVGFGLLTAVQVLLLVLADQSLSTLPWQPLLAIGLALVVGELVWSLRRSEELEDPVVGPGPDGAGTLGPDRLTTIAAAATPWLTPLLTVALCVPWFFV